MRARHEIENLEDKILAPYAMRSQNSTGRVHQEPLHETRTCYQRDRDRIVHLRAFRNLEYKTQVFPIFEGDYYRTRLTHTLEVGQIARTIGRNLMLNEDLIEAIALAHDLGHPPFGHAGEKALNDIMKGSEPKGFFQFFNPTNRHQGFNHNKRSYEIVTREKRYPDFDGLNLSKEVLVGILKHKTVYDIPSCEEGFLNEYPTLEAQVVNVADELTYLNHDIDDGLASKYLSKDDLKNSTLWVQVMEDVQKQGRYLNEDIERNQIVKRLIDIQAKDLLYHSDQELQKKSFSSSDQIKHCPDVVICFSQKMQEERMHLQEILNKKLYHHYLVERMTVKAKLVVEKLFEVYRRNPHQLPYDVYDRNQKYTPDQEKEIICNFIADMTDRKALEEYKKIS